MGAGCRSGRRKCMMIGSGRVGLKSIGAIDSSDMMIAQIVLFI